jgi:dTDP-4-amino-4,6-dideoxygalactose transaminase
MIYYQKPMHLLDAMAYLRYREGDFPAAETASRSVLSLPFHPYLQKGDQERVVGGICGAAGKEHL